MECEVIAMSITSHSMSISSNTLLTHLSAIFYNRQRPPRRSPPRERAREPNHTALTSTRSWSRFTLTLVSPREECPSWTPSSTISSSALLLRLPALPDTTRRPPFLPARSKPLSDSYYLESLPSTPSLREPRPSPSSPPPHKSTLIVGMIWSDDPYKAKNK